MSTFQPEACVAFGIVYARGCEPCPALSCECTEGFSNIGLFPMEGCRFDRCVVALDCASTCLDPGDPDDTARYVALSECAQGFYACSADADCGEGKCYGESRPTGGTCSSGDLFSSCENQTDCLDALFCVSSLDDRCYDGLIGSQCNTDEHCLEGTCVLPDLEGTEPPETPTGICGAGEEGHPCGRDADCIAPGLCNPSELPGPVGGAPFIGTELLGFPIGRCSEP